MRKRLINPHNPHWSVLVHDGADWIGLEAALAYPQAINFCDHIHKVLKVRIHVYPSTWSREERDAMTVYEYSNIYRKALHRVGFLHLVQNSELRLDRDQPDEEYPNVWGMAPIYLSSADPLETITRLRRITTSQREVPPLVQDHLVTTRDIGSSSLLETSTRAHRLPSSHRDFSLPVPDRMETNREEAT